MSVPHIEVFPSRNYGQPSIGNNGVATEWPVRRVYAGESLQSVADDFHLDLGQLLVACWYEGEHSRSRSQMNLAMRDWAKRQDVFDALFEGRYNDCPHPPASPPEQTS